MGADTPSPARMTRARVDALLAAAAGGFEAWEHVIMAAVNGGSEEALRRARFLDHDRMNGMAAAQILRARYLGDVTVATEPQPELLIPWEGTE